MGSLGAVIIPLTWFYIAGFTLLLQAEIYGQIEAAAAERILQEQTAGSVLSRVVPVEPPYSLETSP